ncbi:retrovirus-related pol polyprotein from transposon TNT 1-94 [Tanacetum coccineum]|uniref:Retrovirus-related pol polyprotein from transposon TNT 1-94 n=1 Tax=Tanacetum coccineum TaxID=301880 RepID=A0ABQ5D1P0_9ASTR
MELRSVPLYILLVQIVDCGGQRLQEVLQEKSVLDVEIQIILLENVQNHQKTRTRELLSEAKDETCLMAQASNENDTSSGGGPQIFDGGPHKAQTAPKAFKICLRVDLEPDQWIKYSECSKHMTGNRKFFSTYKAYNGGNVIFGSNLGSNIIGKGTISHGSLKIANVEHVDNLGFNLLSVGQICDSKCKVIFSENDSKIVKDGKFIGRGIRKKGLYVMKFGTKPEDKICLATIDENSTLWHRRLGHSNMRLIQSLASKELVKNLPKLKFDQHFCDACKIEKQAHASHKAKNVVTTTRYLELLHMDLFGPSVVRSYEGNFYTLVIVDDYSRTDHGMEFDNEVQFGEFCNANDTSTYILNQILIRAILGKTPYELLRGRKPTLDYFRVFGSKCFILNTKDYLRKFDPKSYECVFLGYSQNSKAYIILNKNTIKIEESLNVTFDETPPPSKTSPLMDDDLYEEEAIKITEKKNLENDIEDETLEIDDVVNIKESRNHPLENVIGNLNQRTLRYQAQNQSNFFYFISTIEPKNVNEALKDDSWIIAMQEELNQFVAYDVWELVPKPKNMTIIGTKWVYRNKLDGNGVVSRNKARLVTQGYNQQEGIDYDETYAPVARLESIRILLAYACALDFKLFQIDVKSAFLNGFINEEVYMAQPLGFIDFKKPDHVYKLKKALYGHKQAPKAWSLDAKLTKDEECESVDSTKYRGMIDTVMSDSEDSTVTYTAVSSPFGGLSDIISPGVDGPPEMPEDPPVYSEFMPPEDEILPVEDQPLPAAVSPTTQSPGYVLESDPEEEPEEDDEDPDDYPTDRDDDEEDPEEEPADYPVDGGDDGDDEDESSDEDEDDEDVDIEGMRKRRSTHLLPTLQLLLYQLISIRDEPPTPFWSDAEIDRLLAIRTPPPSPLTPLSSLLPQFPSPPLPPILSPLPVSP